MWFTTFIVYQGHLIPMPLTSMQTFFFSPLRRIACHQNQHCWRCEHWAVQFNDCKVVRVRISRDFYHDNGNIAKDLPIYAIAIDTGIVRMHTLMVSSLLFSMTIHARITRASVLEPPALIDNPKSICGLRVACIHIDTCERISVKASELRTMTWVKHDMTHLTLSCVRFWNFDTISGDMVIR